MNTLRPICCSLLTTFALAGCLQQGEGLTEIPPDAGDPPTALAILPPPDMRQEATAAMTTVDLGLATASGGDGVYTFSNDAPPGGFPLGAAMVSWTVTDGTSAQATDMQSVVVSDTIAPNLIAPPDIQTTSTGAMTIVNIGTATASDLVDPSPALANDSSPIGFPVGTTGVTWMATDASGNASTAMQMITVMVPNPGALTLTAPGPVTMEATGPATVVALGAATASGGTPPVTVTNDAPAGGFPVGATTVTWTVVDAAMASVTAMQIVTITDMSAPSITAPVDVTADQDPGGGNTVVALGTPTFADLADPAPVISNDAPVGGFPLGTTTVTWMATDASGNAAMDTQLVTINGSFSVSAPAPITTEATGPTTTVTLGTATASGGVAPVTITDDAPAGGFPVGATTVTWTATDATTATTTAPQVVTITDTTAPSITAPADITAEQDPGGGNTVVALGTATFSDLADPAPGVGNDAPAGGFPLGTTTVTWTVTDVSGNSATDTQLVTITAPVTEMCSAMAPEFVNTIYPIMNSTSPLRCNGCHVGPAPLMTANGWGFPNDPPGDDDFELFRTIASIDAGGQSLILVKSTGGLAHVGGDRWPGRPGDPDWVVFEDFVNRSAACEPDPPVSMATIDIGSGYEQLHRIAATLGSRTPSVDEVNAVGSAGTDQQAIDMVLEGVMNGLMNEEAFYTRVQEMYNDLLLTDRDVDDRGSVDGNFDLDAFANRDYYDDNFSGDERNDLREDANYGFARAPLELVEYVVRNNRPFTEIVTADYTMINPYSAVIYNNDAGDPGFPFSSDQNRANHDRDDFRPVNNIRQQDGTLVPAAGVIGTHAFLARYPSTNTNVNRARARYTFYYFLGLDIESLAARDGLNLDSVIGDVPTFEDPQCTVCHTTMDPVAGLFTNRDNSGEYDTGNTFQHDRRVNGVPRMVPAGYTLDPADELPASEEDTALQWLGSRIAQDDRFAERTVRIVFQGLTGIDATAASTTAFVNSVKNDFVAANFDFKGLVKAIMLSDYFRALNLAVGEDSNDYADIGAARLITPEELDRKVTSITGGNYEWRGPNSNSGLRGRHRLLYGGIDSDEVPTRTTEPTSLMDGIQERISNQVACQRVADDLYNGGTLFPFVDETIIPDGGAGDAAIRQNIQFLHQHILGEDLAVDDAEIDSTMQLFLDVRADGETAIQSACRGGGSNTDSNGTVLPWMAVVTYLLADYRFLYE